MFSCTYNMHVCMCVSYKDFYDVIYSNDINNNNKKTHTYTHKKTSAGFPVEFLTL